MMRRFIAALAILTPLLLQLGCSNPDKPEAQARTLQPYAIHTLPLGVTLDSLQKILHGHSALFHPVVENRMYRIIPLNAYGNVGFGAVELFPDGKSRTYYWYTNLSALTKDQRRYYTADRPAVSFDSCVKALTSVYGKPNIFRPYPKEEWYTWQTDSAQINLTLQNEHITFTKTAPSGVALETDTTEQIEPKPAPTTPKAVKKATPKKKPVAKKPTTKRKTTKKRNTR